MIANLLQGKHHLQDKSLTLEKSLAVFSLHALYIPRRNVSKPAMIIELKFNNSADIAIDQIKRKQYPAKIAEYTGDILLVGINYDKEAKLHTCKIKRRMID